MRKTVKTLSPLSLFFFSRFHKYYRHQSDNVSSIRYAAPNHAPNSTRTAAEKMERGREGEKEEEMTGIKKPPFSLPQRHSTVPTRIIIHGHSPPSFCPFSSIYSTKLFRKGRGRGLHHPAGIYRPQSFVLVKRIINTYNGVS